MFTGIVEELGEVVAVEHCTASASITVRGPQVVSDAAHGSSIAVDGCCLTVVGLDRQAGTFTADVMLETLTRTSLGSLRPGSRVDLERPVPAGGRLGGHVVQGHVDGVGTVVARTPGERWEVVTIALPDDGTAGTAGTGGLARYVVEKGSLAVDGVSLTVASVDGDHVTVSLVPETLRSTTLGHKGVGDPVNLEVDVLAKHVEKLLAHREPAR